jgi:hypothetical protein
VEYAAAVIYQKTPNKDDNRPYEELSAVEKYRFRTIATGAIEAYNREAIRAGTGANTVTPVSYLDGQEYVTSVEAVSEIARSVPDIEKWLEKTTPKWGKYSEEVRRFRIEWTTRVLTKALTDMGFRKKYAGNRDKAIETAVREYAIARWRTLLKYQAEHRPSYDQQLELYLGSGNIEGLKNLHERGHSEDSFQRLRELSRALDEPYFEGVVWLMDGYADYKYAIVWKDQLAPEQVMELLKNAESKLRRAVAIFKTGEDDYSLGRLNDAKDKLGTVLLSGGPEEVQEGRKLLLEVGHHRDAVDTLAEVFRRDRLITKVLGTGENGQPRSVGAEGEGPPRAVGAERPERAEGKAGRDIRKGKERPGK